jgi:hypothetical protein
MGIDIADSQSKEFTLIDKSKHLGRRGKAAARKFPQHSKYCGPISKRPKSDFANDIRMHQQFSLQKQICHFRFVHPQMINPDRCVDENHDLLFRRPTTWNILKIRLAASKQGQPVRRFTLDQRFQRLTNKGTLFLNTGQFLCSGKQFIIEDNSRAHRASPSCASNLSSNDAHFNASGHIPSSAKTSCVCSPSRGAP